MLSQKLLTAAVVAAATFAFGSFAHADTLADWTFETSAPTTGGPLAPESGTAAATATANGHHAGASTYSTPAGNGSVHSFSSNVWAVGDSYEFDVPTTGATALSITFDQTGSATGPRDFKVQTTIDGSTWVDLTNGAYSLPTTTNTAGASTIVAWSTSVATSLSTFAFNLPLGISGIRLTEADTTSYNGGTVATAGTDRVDNVIVSNTAVSTPEPASLGLLGAGAAFIVGRRRRS